MTGSCSLFRFFPCLLLSLSFSQDVTWNKERLAVIVYRSLRLAALRRSSVLLRSASLDFAKLRLGLLAILLSDDTLEFCFVIIVCKNTSKHPPNPLFRLKHYNGTSRAPSPTNEHPAPHKRQARKTGRASPSPTNELLPQNIPPRSS